MKNYFKYIGGFVGIVLLGAGVLWGVREYRYRKSPEYQAIKYFDDLKAKYENDTYGGATPEETLQLFIDALKKGDVELASKYFVVEKQGEWRTKLEKISKEDKVKFLIEDLGNLKLTKSGEEEAFFTLANENKIVLVEMILNKNSKTDKWKISEL
jgi:hypothetical protein